MNRLLYVRMPTERTNRSVLRNCSAGSVSFFIGLVLLLMLGCTYLWANLLVVGLVNLFGFLVLLWWLDAKSVRAVQP